MVRGPVDRMAKGDVAILSLAILSGLRSVGKNVRTLAVRRGSKYDLFTAFHPIWMRLRYTHCLIILKKSLTSNQKNLNFDAKNPQNQHSYQQTQLWRFLARKCKYIWQINDTNRTSIIFGLKIQMKYFCWFSTTVTYIRDNYGAKWLIHESVRETDLWEYVNAIEYLARQNGSVQVRFYCGVSLGKRQKYTTAFSLPFTALLPPLEN